MGGEGGYCIHKISPLKYNTVDVLRWGGGRVGGEGGGGGGTVLPISVIVLPSSGNSTQ